VIRRLGVTTDAILRGVSPDAIEDLAKRWRVSGLPGGPPLSDGDLEVFEQRFRLRLPTAFRRYLLAANGMAASGWDDALIHFWTLDEIAEHLSDRDLTERFPFVPFADYSINIWVWALPLDPDGTVADSVFTFGPPFAPFADTFLQFVSEYLSGANIEPKVLTPRDGQLHWHHGV
jgi:hypothetical protein